MGLVVLVPDLVAGKVGVDLGRGDVGVAEHLLDVPKGCATSEHVGGEAMTEDVGGYGGLYLGLFCVTLQDKPEALPA